MSERPVPPSLTDPDLTPLWRQVRHRLDRFGPARRGTIERPDALGPEASRALRNLLDRTRLPQRLDLGELERALVRLGVGPDLDSALEALGQPPSAPLVERRHQRQQAQARRQSAHHQVQAWPEPWAEGWLAEIGAAGLVADHGPDLVAQVRRLLDALANPAVMDRLVVNEQGLRSRTDLAAEVFGSAHALDTSTPLHRAALRALTWAQPDRAQTGRAPDRAQTGRAPDRAQTGRAPDRAAHPPVTQAGDDHRAMWAAAGFHLDTVSAPVLTWALDQALDPAPASPLRHLASVATDAGLPLHLTPQALDRHPLAARPGATVLVSENPRVVEAAAQSRVGFAVITTNGNPTTAPITLITQLLVSGATVAYHGDFDSPGLAICGRMADLGCQPWLMGVDHYQAALDRARAEGLDLPLDSNPAGPTPWDPRLATQFNRHRLIVHEERLLRALLAGPPSPAPG